MIKVEKEIELTGEELAKEFWSQDCIEEADFFNKNQFFEDGNDGHATMLIYNIVEFLDDNGKRFIKMIYDSLMELEEENK